MSQFLIGRGPRPEVPSGLNYILLAESQDGVRSAAQALFGNDWTDGWQLVDATGDTAEELFDIGYPLTQGTAFQATQLYEVLNALCSEGCSLHAFYGSDYAELSCFTEKLPFLSHVQQAVSYAPCEVYATFCEKK